MNRMEIIKSWLHVRLAFFKNVLPLTIKYFSAYFRSVSYQQVVIRDVLLLSHSLEKGLIYNYSRPDWGVGKANSLIDRIEYLLKNRYNSNSYEIKEGLSILEVYSEKTQKKAMMNKLLSLKKLYEISYSTIPAGKYEVTSAKIFDYNDVESFIRSRRSIRFFKENRVDENIILKAVEMANCTPSACNRQPCKVYYTNESSTIEEMGKYFKTAYRFETGVPQLLVITSSLSLFSSDEYLQPLINGGMYVSYLLLAFHSLGIGTTPLEMVAFKSPEKEIRKKLGIKGDEIIVTAIAIGYPLEVNNITCGTRRTTDGVAIKY
ncbi:nitroreductase family protein [Bacteroides bouchesdurhonensis]|uniref:nitroreductase family protein n=1 Tax=Bacteroides bouchesdurhonensis TaxID=1841855 RepID=UPI00097F96BE|nr:nitroreductase family protein [Bacteroides bouchesdurhonensis]